MFKRFFIIFNFYSEIPPAPSNIKVTNITSSYAKISWSHTESQGVFTVVCKSCSGTVFPLNTTEKALSVSNLGSFATYEIAVTYSNSITESIGETISSDYVTFKTLAGGWFYYCSSLNFVENVDLVFFNFHLRD